MPRIVYRNQPPSFLMIERYFCDERIINQLCKERVKLAGQRHDRQYINRLAGYLVETEPDHPFYHLLPPRRQWSSFRPRNRTNGSNPDLFALKTAVQVLRRQQTDLPWVIALNRYIGEIQERVFNSAPFSISSPTVNWQLKKKGGQEYRALCRFSPNDNLILCLFAQYLRDAFDPLFSGASFAFRAVRDGHAPTHHDAFNQLHHLKNTNASRSFYVAECDIKGFFDTVDHRVALEAFQEVAGTLCLPDRAEVLFRAYLDCYSFPVNVLEGALPGLQRRHPEGYFKWPENDLRDLHGTDPRSLRIGVAQGGAVSGIIANLIMDWADKGVEAESQKLGAEIHYFRYCDDMLLLSANLKHCRAVFDVYQQKLRELKLVCHKPERTCIYGKNHWNHKSKAPYLWSGRRWFGHVPWVQFVGYQIRYDGLVRPRKESVAKQCMKLVESANLLKFGLLRASGRNPVLATKNQAQASLRSKLTAMGVGRVKGRSVGPRPMCWAWGYQALHNKPLVGHTLSVFDKAREKQLRRFGSATIRYGPGRVSSHRNRQDPWQGSTSYRDQFTDLGGQWLIHNPWKPSNILDKCKAFIFKQSKSIINRLDRKRGKH